MKYCSFANCGVCKGNIFFAFVSDKANVSNSSANRANSRLISYRFLIKVIVMVMKNYGFLIVVVIVVVIVVLLGGITHSGLVVRGIVGIKLICSVVDCFLLCCFFHGVFFLSFFAGVFLPLVIYWLCFLKT